MQQTTNYALKKIDLTDSPPDITVLNPNFDAIDAEMKANALADAAHKAESTAHGIDLKANKLQEVWIAPTLLNGWVNFDTNEFHSVGYMKDSLGFIHLKGIIKSGTVTAVGFTLPVGYRPLKQMLILTLSNNNYGYISIWPSGDVTMQNGSNVYFILDNITFKAEQ